jgi:hypothetical protein
MATLWGLIFTQAHLRHLQLNMSLARILFKE